MDLPPSTSKIRMRAPLGPSRAETELGGHRNVWSAPPRGATPLGVSDGLVGEVGDVALDGLGVDEAHGFLVGGLAEEALAGPEHHREDLQPQLVDEVVLHHRAYELEAGGNDDFTG